MQKLLYRPAEVVELMSLSRSTVYALLKSGVIPSIRVNRSVRIPADALREWIARQQEEQTSQAA